MRDKTGHLIDFHDSKLARLYLGEIYCLSHKMRERLSELFRQLPPSKKIVSAETSAVFDLIYSALASASQIKEMFNENPSPFPTRARTKEQKARQAAKRKHFHKLHKERAQYIRSQLGELTLSEIGNKSVRNSIEHIPQYMDLANEEHTFHKCKGKYAVAFNLIVYSWVPVTDSTYPKGLYQAAGVPVPILPLRVYAIRERKFYNLDRSVDLKALHDEAGAIMKALRPRFSHEPEEWSTAFCICGNNLS